MRLEDLMERAAKYDENHAHDIKDYVHGRKYGLVYEASVQSRRQVQEKREDSHI